MVRSEVSSSRRGLPTAATLRVLVVGCLLGVALLGLPGVANAAKGKVAVEAACAGDVLSGSVTVGGLVAGTVVTVTAEAKNTNWQQVGQPATFTVVSSQSTYAVRISVPGVSGYKEFRLRSDAGSGVTANSKNLKPQDCAPPTQVPEVPVPLLIPVTMLLTFLAVDQFRRNRASVAIRH